MSPFAKNVMFGCCVLLIFVQIPVLNSEVNISSFAILSRINEVLDEIGGDDQCVVDLKTMINEAASYKRWALEMFDASTKLSSGLMSGNKFMMGNFDQCLQIANDNSTILGQYCTAISVPRVVNNDSLVNILWNVKNNLKTELLQASILFYGFCIPHTCTAIKLEVIWNYIERVYDVPLHLFFANVMCNHKEKKMYTFSCDQYIINGFKLYGLILLLSTLYDIFVHQRKQDKTETIWLSFSVYTNVKKIFSTKEKPQHHDHLQCVNGIKFISMLWVIYGHRSSFNIFAVYNFYELYKWIDKVAAAIVISGPYAVDTFFFIGGLLVSHGVLSAHRSKGLTKIPVLALYFVRFLRLTPGLLALISFSISVFKYFGSGPMWLSLVVAMSQICRDNWYAPLLYYHNYLDIDKQCLPHTWYVSADMQLFLVSPIIMTFLLKNPKKTCLLSVVVCILGAIYAYVITVQNNYTATFSQLDFNYFQYVVQPTLIRMPPWFIGSIFGYIVFKYNHVKIPKVLRILAWLVIFYTLAKLVLLTLEFSNYDEYSEIKAGLFNALAKQIWAIAIGSLVFLCVTDIEDPVNKFLSIQFFQIGVRISYSVYLVHVPVLGYFIGSKRNTTYFRDVDNVHDFAGDLLFISITAILWCLAFESPFIAIAQHLLRGGSPSKEVSKSNQKSKKTSLINGDVSKVKGDKITENEKID